MRVCVCACMCVCAVLYCKVCSFAISVFVSVSVSPLPSVSHSLEDSTGGCCLSQVSEANRETHHHSVSYVQYILSFSLC